MKIFLVMLLFMSLVIISGCALLDKIAPAQYDESGNIIPGSREPIEITKAIADVVPYGNVALPFILMVAAGYEKFRAYKLEKGLKATLLAGKQIANDPQLAEMWQKIKDEYRQAHENAGVTNLIKALLAKLPSVTKSI